MSKASSDKHIADLKKKYLDGKTAHRTGKIVIAGFNPNGLGGEISRQLTMGYNFSYVYKLGAKQLDVTWPEKKVASVFRRIKSQNANGFKDIIALINCAAIMDLRWFEDYPIKRVRQIIETNLIGAYNITKQFVKATIDVPKPKYIVHIGSMAARVPLNGSAPYCASKAGLEMLTRCMAWELAPKNYNVLCINPSNIANSPMEQETIGRIQKLRGIPYEEAKGYWRSGMIRNDLLSKQEIVEIIELFINGKCNYLSGSAINLAGGLR